MIAMLFSRVIVDILNEEESAAYLSVVMALDFESNHNEPTRDQNCLDNVLVSG